MTIDSVLAPEPASARWLGVEVILLAVCVGIAPLLATNQLSAVLSWIFTVPPLVMASTNVVQTRRGSVPTFRSGPLILGAALLLLGALLWWSVVLAPIGVALAVVATPLLASSWVQPRRADEAFVGFVGTGLGALIPWLVIAEVAGFNSILPALGTGACFFILGRLRRRGVTGRGT